MLKTKRELVVVMMINSPAKKAIVIATQLFIYLPKDLVKDSVFHFKAEDLITIRVDGKGLRIDPIAS